MNAKKASQRKQRSAASGQWHTDRYCTPREILDLVAVFWPQGIGIDPCWDPTSLVTAQIQVDHREGGDGLGMGSWAESCAAAGAPQTVWMNPPYSKPAPWLAHATIESKLHPEVEILALITVASGTVYWSRHVWPQFSALGFVGSPRIRYLKQGKQMKSSTIGVDHAIVYYAGQQVRREGGVDRFRDIFARRCAKILV